MNDLYTFDISKEEGLKTYTTLSEVVFTHFVTEVFYIVLLHFRIEIRDFPNFKV